MEDSEKKGFFDLTIFLELNAILPYQVHLIKSRKNLAPIWGFYMSKEAY